MSTKCMPVGRQIGAKRKICSAKQVSLKTLDQSQNPPPRKQRTVVQGSCQRKSKPTRKTTRPNSGLDGDATVGQLHQHMTEEEKREDRARRNRASALKSRNKKRVRLAFLEEEHKRLCARIRELEHLNTNLQQENTKLRRRQPEVIASDLATLETLIPEASIIVKREAPVFGFGKLKGKFVSPIDDFLDLEEDITLPPTGLDIASLGSETESNWLSPETLLVS